MSDNLLHTVIKELKTEERAKIPTSLVPLAPEKVSFEPEGVDVLFGLFHIMWSDMPKPRTYALKLADVVSRDGDYLGCKLECASGRAVVIEC